MGDSWSVGEWCGRLIDESRSASCWCHACLRHPLDARRGPCCCPGRFKGRVPRPLVHPLCPLNPAGDTPLPDRHRSRGNCMGPSPSRTTVFPVEPSWSLGRPALLCSTGPVPVPPRDSATCFRRNPRPEGASTWRLGSPGVRPPFLATSTGTFTASFIAVWTWR